MKLSVWLGRFGAGLGLLFGAVCELRAAKAETWLRVSTPEFTVVTSLKEKDAVAWAGEFAQFIAAMNDYFTNGKRRLVPLTVVLFARERDFVAYRPIGADGKVLPVAGFFSRREAWAVAGINSIDASEELRRTIFHEGTHWFMSAANEQYPVWLEEGLAEVFSTFRVVNGQAEWGRGIGLHLLFLKQIRALPLGKLLATSRDELFHGASERTGIIYAQSWAFVHYLTFGQHQIPRQAITDYLDFLRTAQNPEEAFSRAFGRTSSEMDKELARYCEAGTYYINRKPLAVAEVPRVSPATEAEVADALGRLALSGGRPELAVTHARAAVRLAEAVPSGYELLGLALKASGDEAGARAAFVEAAERKSRDFQVYFELAQAEQREAVTSGSSIDSMPAEAARRIANRYERAINLHPRFLASFQNLAGIMNLVEPVGDADREFLELGRRLYPQDQMIAIGLAVLAKKMGDGVKARSILNEVLSAKGQPPDVRTFANNLDLAWGEQEIFDQINALAHTGKFTEAVELINKSLEQGMQPRTRIQFVGMLRELKASARGQEIKRALDESRWSDARRLLGELLESDASAFAKAEAKRSLELMDRQKLGLKPTP